MAPLNAWTVRPEDYRQPGDKDWTAAFQKLFADVTRRLIPDAGGSVPVSTVEVLLTGVYTVSDTIMPAGTGRAQGLTVRGRGKRASEIVMTAPKPLLVNHDQWMGLRFYDLSFRSTNPGASWMYSWSTGGAQDMHCRNVEWRGTWKYGIGLDGPQTSNCNSEMLFDGCQVGGDYATAWFWSGMTPGIAAQDQFLNYWFRDMKVEYGSGTALRFDRGGSVAISGGSWILEGTRPDKGQSRFIQLAGGTHADSVQKLAVRDVRFELRNSTHQVIQSAWTGSQIIFDGCDDTALGFQPFSQTLVAHEYINPGITSYRNCVLVGKHSYSQTQAPGRQMALYLGCTRKNNRTATSFLVRNVTPNLAGPGLRFTHLADGDGIG